MEQNNENLLKISRELREKIENFAGDVVFLENGQVFILRYSMRPEEIKKSCSDALPITEKINNGGLLGCFGAINGKLLIQVAVDEGVPRWRNKDYMNKPATFPMTPEEREILNS